MYVNTDQHRPPYTLWTYEEGRLLVFKKDGWATADINEPHTWEHFATLDEAVNRAKRETQYDIIPYRYWIKDSNMNTVWDTE